MSIAVEDWDELAEPQRERGRRGKSKTPPARPEAAPVREAPAPRATPAPAARAEVRRAPSAPSAPRQTAGALRARVAAAPAPEPQEERTLGTAVFADDHYGDTLQNLRVPACIAGANVLVWLVGLLGGVVEMIGVAFFVSVGLLFAAYVLREWQRDRTALICLAGAIPLPVTIFSFFT